MGRVAPFIRPVATQGGTFYTFSSAAEDLTLSFNDSSEVRFRFSKFALLNVPDIVTNPVKNTVKFNAIPGAYKSVNFERTSDYNVHLAESFQNYCLNLETLLMSRDDYDPSAYKSVTERVFWKWMKEISAVRWRNSEINSDVDLENPLRFEEELTSLKYDRVVQHIGHINFHNRLNTKDNTYTEVYIHVPNTAGTTPRIFFKTLRDNNYFEGMTIKRPSTKNLQDNEFVAGRNFNDEHPANMDFHAFYDNDSGLGTLQNRATSGIEQYKKILGRTGDLLSIEENYLADQWWYRSTTETNSFFTEQETLQDAGFDDLAIYSSRGGGFGVNRDEAAIRFRRSRLDGVEIDWNLETYRRAKAGLQTLAHYNNSPQAEDFKFNAILIYYDLYVPSDASTDTTTQIIEPVTGEAITLYPNEEILATNLFGILFLDDVQNDLSLGGGQIPRYSKCIPSEKLRLNGNAYSIKLNLSLNTSYIDTGVSVQTYIDTGNTFSLDVFADALNVMRQSGEDLTEFTQSLLASDRSIQQLLAQVGQTDATAIKGIIKRIQDLEGVLSNSEDKLRVLHELSGLISLVESNTKTLNDLLSGKINSSGVRFDFDMFREGSGIKLEQNGNQTLTVSTSTNQYNLTENPIISAESFTDDPAALKYVAILQNGFNYYRFENNSTFIPSKNIEFIIDDGFTQWVRGQSFKIYFATPCALNNDNGSFNFTIMTDAHNITFQQEVLSHRIGLLNSNTFANKGNMPCIEIICIDDKELKFVVDVK